MTRTVLLGDVTEINPETVGKKYTFNEILYLDTSSVTENKFSDLKPYKLINAPSRAKRIVRHGDIVYSTVRPNLKHYGYIQSPADNTIASTGFAVIRAKDGLDSKYLYYWLASNERTEYLTSIADSQTSTFPAFNPSVLETLKIELPDLEAQGRIADILGTIDEKIDLNRKMNETLEQMGQALFKKYFITNPAAKTWPIGTISDLGQVITGKTPSKTRNDFYGEGVPFLKVPDMHNQPIIINTVDNLTNLGADSQANKYIPKWSTMVSCIATVGVISLAGKQMQTNQQINSIVPKNEVYTFFNYFLLISNKPTLKSMASSGSAVPNLNKAHFENINIVIPPNILLEKFHNEIKPTFLKIETNIKEIQILTNLRDSLLPRLINGKISI